METIHFLLQIVREKNIANYKLAYLKFKVINALVYICFGRVAWRASRPNECHRSQPRTKVCEIMVAKSDYLISASGQNSLIICWCTFSNADLIEKLKKILIVYINSIQ